MRAAYLFLLFLPAGLLAQGQYDLGPLPPFPDHVQYTHYSDQIDNPDYYDYQEVTPRPPEEQLQQVQQQQVQEEVIPAPTLEPGDAETEPTEPGPLGEVCFYSLRRVYVVNKEICVRTVCAHEELLRADLCRDKFSKCGVMASSGLCQSVAASCARSCGGC
ncbi:microfibrillar-associated protein 2 isoform X3 [Diceros bicornis minor]|uniref:microfibrillar-associated protein 2 isoform X3 n=1 Tax=Diceros bicornis minor TaxID=77932 RepID=UPI0026F045DA|nr:microfibrillar-associated protein 2 isoform X3 [Diceros bicornis minor]